MTDAIPEYVYQDHSAEKSLLQGDILKVEGSFRNYFKEFYPAINHPDGKDKYVMVLTQSCDLVKSEKRKPKLSHINVCLVRGLNSVIERVITDEIKPLTIGDKNILQQSALDQLKDKLAKLLNNTDQKTHFFLPMKAPFTKDMVAILPLSFSFRTDHYDLMLNNRVLSLKPEFQAKVGHIISQLYGRIGTHDLYDAGWDDKRKREYINQLLKKSNLVQVPDKSFINYIKTHANNDASNVENLISDYEALKVISSFKPLQNELIQKIRAQLMKLFDDQEKINYLTQADKPARSKEIQNIFNLCTGQKIR